MKANHTAHVLLLDADPTESRLIQQTLTRSTPGFRCKVDIVSTPLCAEKRLRQTRFDDVIVNLPTDNGDDLKTVQRIHDRHPDVPILMLTESTDAGMRRAALRHGASDCFTKNADAYQEMHARIRHLMQEREILINLVKDSHYRKSLLANAPCPIVCLSSDRRIVEFNSQAERLWQYPSHKAVGMDFINFFVADNDRYTLTRDFTRTLSGHATRNCKTTVVSHDNPCTIHWDMSSTKDTNSDVVTVMAIGHNCETTVECGPLSADHTVRRHANFEDTAAMVLGALSTIIERVDRLNDADPVQLQQLSDQWAESQDKCESLSSEKASAVERLVLSLLIDKIG